MKIWTEFNWLRVGSPGRKTGGF